jgi:GAF domain-containing protein
MPDQPVPDQPVPVPMPAYLRELTALLLSTTNVEQALGRLADVAAHSTPGASMVGVTLQRGGRVLTVASTSAHAMMIDEIQYNNGQGGPCLEAMRTGEIVTVTDMPSEQRWGDYASQMLAHGVHGIYSHPLRGGEELMGALNVYATTDAIIGPAARQAIAATAEHAGVLLQAVLTTAQHVELTDDLRQSLSSRAVIDQALGIIMGQRRCTASHAFEVLRLASQSRNRKLHDVAADIVTAVTGQPPEPPPFAAPGAPV